MMLDEFPALGRLDFFETALAFMAGYGIRAFLIAQSLNQIDKAYGENNSILDNCHVRVAFATNDERTAKRISDALGTATEQRAMRNYAGHRLAPWLAHVMVSRQETARPLLTPGEVMQLAADATSWCWSPGTPPIRAQEAALFRGPQLHRRACAAAGAWRRRLCRPARAARPMTGRAFARPRCRLPRTSGRRRRRRRGRPPAGAPSRPCRAETSSLDGRAGRSARPRRGRGRSAPTRADARAHAPLAPVARRRRHQPRIGSRRRSDAELLRAERWREPTSSATSCSCREP